MSPPPHSLLPARLRTLLQLDFSMDPAVGSPLLLGGGPPKAEPGAGQRQGESLLPFGVAAPGTAAPGTDRASQAAVAAWERAHGIGGGAVGVAPPAASDLGGAVLFVPSGNSRVAGPSRPPLAAPAHGPGSAPSSAHPASPTVIALAASALGLALVVALVVAGLVARGVAVRRRRKEEEVEGGAAGRSGAAASTSPSPTAAPAAGPAWWQRLTVAGPAAIAPFSGEDSALATPSGGGGDGRADGVGLPTSSGPPGDAAASPGLSPGLARRLVSVDDSAYGEEGPPSAAATPAQASSSRFFFFNRNAGSGRGGGGGADPEAGV